MPQIRLFSESPDSVILSAIHSFEIFYKIIGYSTRNRDSGDNERDLRKTIGFELQNALSSMVRGSIATGGENFGIFPSKRS